MEKSTRPLRSSMPKTCALDLFVAARFASVAPRRGRRERRRGAIAAGVCAVVNLTTSLPSGLTTNL